MQSKMDDIMCVSSFVTYEGETHIGYFKGPEFKSEIFSKRDRKKAVDRHVELKKVDKQPIVYVGEN